MGKHIDKIVLDPQRTRELIDDGYRYAVVVIDGYGDIATGDVISVHKLLEVAQRKANYTGHWAVQPLDNYL
ncbi:hypothetical protein [Crenobacter cavernae]|uniref:Uncharacterized protein n=1 Tax=Crenobacter cavernae TaxID=2290923 RepID=A0A345Y9N8_9NEIS|nr:hypothetical protein [Crenobacter cavernae]AXK40640.1 hypothetical protein DWG20_15095 [Crenobacter cavernae]